jgi:hypothetical protein
MGATWRILPDLLSFCEFGARSARREGPTASRIRGSPDVNNRTHNSIGLKENIWAIHKSVVRNSNLLAGNAKTGIDDHREKKVEESSRKRMIKLEHDDPLKSEEGKVTR